MAGGNHITLVNVGGRRRKKRSVEGTVGLKAYSVYEFVLITH